MKKYYAKFTPQSFKIFAIIALAVMDLVGSLLVYLRFSDKEAFIKSWNELEKSGMLQLTQGDPTQFALQIQQIFLNSVLMMIAFHILFHWGVYLAYYFEKKLAYLYLKLVTWFFAIFSTIFALASLSEGSPMGVVFLIQAAIYLFVAYGLKLFQLK